MTEIIDRIFAELKAEIEKDPGPLTFPEIEEELKPFVLRELTPQELRFLGARVKKMMASDRMYREVGLLQALGQHEQLDNNQRQNELIRFHAEILDNLFYWALNESTGWKYASLIQRQDGDKKVIIGLTGPEARKFYDEKEAKEALAQEPVSSLVN